MGWLVLAMVSCSVFSELERQRQWQVDTEFKTSLGYVVSSKPAWVTQKDSALVTFLAGVINNRSKQLKEGRKASSDSQLRSSFIVTRKAEVDMAGSSASSPRKTTN